MATRIRKRTLRAARAAGMVVRLLAATAAACLLLAQSPPRFMIVPQRWVTSRSMQIAVSAGGKETQITDGMPCLTPAWSATGAQVAFVRLVASAPRRDQWKTRVCVIGADGRGLHELTAGETADFGPTWTRDGTNRIIFTRLARGVESSETSEIYLTHPDGVPRGETLVSDPKNPREWADSGLKDGRIFVDRLSRDERTHELIERSFLLTPRPGGTSLYEEVRRPFHEIWHKLSVSPGETKVVYMLDRSHGGFSPYEAVLQVADFDVKNRIISNPVSITDPRPTCIYEYPRWSADGTLILYDSNCSGRFQVDAYRLADRSTHRISPDPDLNYKEGSFENAPP
jgi:hypothetical protein